MSAAIMSNPPNGNGPSRRLSVSPTSCVSLLVIVVLLLTDQGVGAESSTTPVRLSPPQTPQGRRNNNNKQTLQRGTRIGEVVNAEELYRAYQAVQKDYQTKAHDSADWRILSKTPDGIEIAMLKTASDPTCPYIRMTATMPAKVENLWNFLSFSNWDKTMPKINPFYEGLEIEGQYNRGDVSMILVRKRTTRIFGFGRRDFCILSVNDVPRDDGVWVSGMVSVITPRLPRRKGYKRAFQDSISFYKPVRGDQGQELTKLTVICRTDLNDSAEDGSGGWIPMWLYLKTIGHAGTRALQGLRHLVQADCAEQETSMKTTVK